MQNNWVTHDEAVWLSLQKISSKMLTMILPTIFRGSFDCFNIHAYERGHWNFVGNHKTSSVSPYVISKRLMHYYSDFEVAFYKDAAIWKFLYHSIDVVVWILHFKARCIELTGENLVNSHRGNKSVDLIRRRFCRIAVSCQLLISSNAASLQSCHYSSKRQSK